MLESELELTFHLQDDWLGLHQPGADGQSAAVLPSICQLHAANAATHEDPGQSAALGTPTPPHPPSVGPAYLISDR